MTDTPVTTPNTELLWPAREAGHHTVWCALCGQTESVCLSPDERGECPVDVNLARIK